MKNKNIEYKDYKADEVENEREILNPVEVDTDDNWRRY